MTKIVAAGMPASGKSTFIAALTHLLTAEQVPTELRLSRLSENEAHLSRLEKLWLDASRLDRTKASSEQWVSFFVEDSESGIVSELSVPDLRGELFAQPATLGRCDKRLWDALVECDGLLLFTNANARTDDMMIDQISLVIDAFADSSDEGREVKSGEGGDERASPISAKFSADDIPEEAKLVEFLQAMNRYPISRKFRRLALIVSAWDVVEEADPPAWMSSCRPMLDQYLKNAGQFWEVRIYGVSAQGGCLPSDQGRLKAVRRPGERVQVVGIDVSPHDLTSIVKWVAMGKG